MSTHDATDSQMLTGEHSEILVPGWLIGWIGTVAAALTGAVVFLFKALSSSYAKQLSDAVSRHDAEIGELKCDRDQMRTETEQCRKDREQLKSQVAELTTRIEFLEPNQ